MRFRFLDWLLAELSSFLAAFFIPILVSVGVIWTVVVLLLRQR